MKLRDIVKENPDSINIGKIRLYYTDGRPYAFGFYKGKAYVSDLGGVHFKIKDDLLDRGMFKTDVEYAKFPKNRGEYDYSGRMWTKNKIISFWEYPTPGEFKGLISKLEKASGVKIWNNKWRVEVIDNNGKIYRPDSRANDPLEPDWNPYDYQEFGKIKLIPVEKYVGSNKQVGKELSHQKSPMLKKQKVVPKGVGSMKKVPGQKPGEVPAAARFRLRKGLGDGVINLKNLIREIIFILYEDQSDELVKIARTQNGLIDPKGNVHAIPSLEHVEYLVTQPKFKMFKNRLAHANGDEWSIIYDAIMNEAMKDGWVRISGNRNEIGFMATNSTLMKRKSLINDIVMFVESVVKRPVKVYRSAYTVKQPQKVNYNKDFGND